MPKLRLKYILFTTFLILFSIGFVYRDLIGYGILQGKGQLKVLLNSRSLEETMADPEFPDSLKAKLQLIPEIKRFAIEEFGMSGTDNYSTVYDQKGKDILWNVTGCKPYSFEAYRWWFPVVGTVPYKGYFDIELAKKEAMRVEAEGYETRIRSVSAWSTLGWFKDPILSNTLSRSESSIAETIFHELTHATVFFPDSVEFNETLDSFVESSATIQYLSEKYGEQSEEIQKYLEEERDSQAYHLHFLRGKERLDSLYRSFNENTDTTYMRMQKELVITEVIEKLDTVSFKNERYYQIWKNKPLPNNAYFMYFARYYDTPYVLAVLLSNVNNDIRRFLEAIKEMNR
jgi:predicted aminopeptidase